MHAHIYLYIKEQLTEFEHEPATLGERCTVTSAIVLFLLGVVGAVSVETSYPRPSLWPTLAAACFSLSFAEFVGLMRVYECVWVYVESSVGQKFTNAFSFCRRRFLSLRCFCTRHFVLSNLKY